MINTLLATSIAEGSNSSSLHYQILKDRVVEDMNLILDNYGVLEEHWKRLSKLETN